MSRISAESSAGELHPSSDSFIRGAIDAWAQHQHLVIRPDEVWFAVLIQMNFYMSKHAEAIRHLFVDHQDQEEIILGDDTWEDVLLTFKDEIQARVKTDWLLDWIMPNFTTTSEDDIMTANVLMMGLMQTFFSFTGYMTCGLPSVTLLGEKNDWKRLLVKLDHLKDFGDEPSQYADKLRPIFRRFVRTFEEPDSPHVREFWNQIVTAEPQYICGLPPYRFNGWLMGFCHWDESGDLKRGSNGTLSLDGIHFPNIGMDSIPIGYAKAPFKMLDYRGMKEFPAFVLAGNIAKRVQRGVPEGYAASLRRFNGSELDNSLPNSVLQPLSGWMVYGPAQSSGNRKPYHDDAELLSLQYLMERTAHDLGGGDINLDL